MKDLQGRHKGQRAFVVGNGPSLLDMDLDRLMNEVTFGMNAVARIFDETRWRPTYYMASTTIVSDPHYRPWALRAIEEAQQAFIFRDAPEGTPGTRLNFKNSDRDTGVGREEWWSDDPTKIVSRFATTSLPCMQMAAWMGLDPIYLIGMDLGYSEHTRLGEDPNHFDPDYNEPRRSANWATINDAQKSAHWIAKKNAERLGIDIYNATPGGDLSVYPRVEYDALWELEAA